MFWRDKECRRPGDIFDSQPDLRAVHHKVVQAGEVERGIVSAAAAGSLADGEAAVGDHQRRPGATDGQVQDVVRAEIINAKAADLESARRQGGSAGKTEVLKISGSYLAAFAKFVRPIMLNDPSTSVFTFCGTTTPEPGEVQRRRRGAGAPIRERHTVADAGRTKAAVADVCPVERSTPVEPSRGVRPDQRAWRGGDGGHREIEGDGVNGRAVCATDAEDVASRGRVGCGLNGQG